MNRIHIVARYESAFPGTTKARTSPSPELNGVDEAAFLRLFAERVRHKLWKIFVVCCLATVHGLAGFRQHATDKLIALTHPPKAPLARANVLAKAVPLNFNPLPIYKRESLATSDRAFHQRVERQLRVLNHRREFITPVINLDPLSSLFCVRCWRRDYRSWCICAVIRLPVLSAWVNYWPRILLVAVQQVIQRDLVAAARLIITAAATVTAAGAPDRNNGVAY